MSDQFIGEIRIVAFNFAPIGWALCDGQVLPINQNAALASLIVDRFGGNGTSTFALPDYRAATPIGQGHSPGLSPRAIGDRIGANTVPLSTGEMPAHDHGLFGDTSAGTQKNPSGNLLAEAMVDPTFPGLMYSKASPKAMMLTNNLAPAGNGQAHNNMQPYLTVNFIIALTGEYPDHP